MTTYTLQQALQLAMVYLEDAFDIVHRGDDSPLTYAEMDDMAMLTDAMKKVRLVAECNRIKL